ncbi:MAG: hypothetical protein Kow0013_04840 [Pararhodobacter sp.]
MTTRRPVLARLSPGLVAGALALAQPAIAQLPENACYAMRLDARALANEPERGVAELYVHFIALTRYDRSTKGQWRHVRLTAVMAGQGQGLRDHAAGATLTAVAECRTERLSCWAHDNTASFELTVHDARTIALRTRHFPVADYGGSMMASDLAESANRDTVYLLSRLNDGPCPVE